MKASLIKNHVILILSVLVIYGYFKWGCDPFVEKEYQYSIGIHTFRISKINPSALSPYIVNVDLVRPLLPNVSLLSYYGGDSIFLRRINDSSILAEIWSDPVGNEWLMDTAYLHLTKPRESRLLRLEPKNYSFDQWLYERWIAGDTVLNEGKPN